jgi:transcriptional regulator with XRE-family HTH domain
MRRAADLVRAVRRSANLTQAELATRMGTSQGAVAQLERPESNPTMATLERALQAAGHRLDVSAQPHRSSVDETLVASMLRMTPEQRLASFESGYESVRQIALAGARARGELA